MHSYYNDSGENYRDSGHMHSELSGNFNIKTLDEKLHSEYVEQRLVDTTTPISHSLSKQQLTIVSKRGAKSSLSFTT